MANAGDFDSENLFPPLTFTEELADAASGSFEVQPQKTLRDRQYQNQPLVIRPKYEGDFLEKLRNKTAADSDNLQDFTMPSEMLKHQEQPFPRDLQDEFYDINRLEDEHGSGMDYIRDYYDRGWDPEDAPEMSEDKIDRMNQQPNTPIPEPVKLKIRQIVTAYVERVTEVSHMEREERQRAGMVVAKFLNRMLPLGLDLDPRQGRTAKLLQDLRDPRLFTKRKKDKVKNIHAPDIDGAKKTIRLVKAEPNIGRWTFRTGSKGYSTIFQFIPNGNVREVNKLHVRVSCSCPSWIYWGAQYWAHQGDYLYGMVHPVLAKPGKRDPSGAFTICKHVAACIPTVYNYRIGVIAPSIKDKLKAVPKIKVDKELPTEKVKIPAELQYLGKEKIIQDLETSWAVLKPDLRRKGIMSLTDPNEVAYFAYRFPETATGFVAEKLKEMSQKPQWKRKAEDLLAKIEGHKKEHEEKKVTPAPKTKIPSQFHVLDKSGVIENLLKDWDKKNPEQRKEIINRQTNPDIIAYFAYKFPDDPVVADDVVEKMEGIIKGPGSKAVKNKAQKWLDEFLGKPAGIKEPEVKPEEPEKEEIKIPTSLRIFEKSVGVQTMLRNWDKKTPEQRLKIINKPEDPDIIAYIAFKYPDMKKDAIKRLEDISKSDKSRAVKNKAEKWLSRI